jgi:streptogramin lyase
MNQSNKLSYLVRGAICTALLVWATHAGSVAWAAGFQGQVTDDKAGTSIAGAMVTARFGEPFQERTVFTDDEGRYAMAGLPAVTNHRIRVRRIGWEDLRSWDHQTAAEGLIDLDLGMARHTDPAEVAAQLPANHWYALVLDKLTDKYEREQFVRQCTFCHQQGNAATRLVRDIEEWDKVLALMARMGAGLDADLRARMPELLNAAYDPETAVPALTQGWENAHEFSPAPSAEVRRSIIDEYQLGGRSSVQHDMIVHPSGHIYSVDMTTDTLYRMDPRVADGGREAFRIPTEGLALGGGLSAALPSNSDMRVGPHSLQVDGDGAVWITLAVGNLLAKFDPTDSSFAMEPLPGGIYPHTLRVDDRGRIWYTIAVSNHVGMYDPATGQHETIRVPARSFGEAVMLRALPFVIWLSQYVDLDIGGGGEGGGLPTPYGIDFAPNGDVWFSQLNAHRIGRIDPESFEITMIDTPFSAPRRMRFDSKGMLWIPGFSSNVLSRFDPQSSEFTNYTIPVEPVGTETPYSLNVDRRTDTVWICGTNSDTLISFNTSSEQFTIYPLPTQVTYTRDIDFDTESGIWTSNSNAPTWQIETGVPRVLRLIPGRDPDVSMSVSGSR